jgi:hypothetical protein
MSKEKTKPESISTILNSELDSNTLSITDIKKDLAHCNRMIERTQFKIKAYQQKLDQLNKIKKTTISTINKGLRLFNLIKNISKKV